MTATGGVGIGGSRLLDPTSLNPVCLPGTWRSVALCFQRTGYSERSATRPRESTFCHYPPLSEASDYPQRPFVAYQMAGSRESTFRIADHPGDGAILVYTAPLVWGQPRLRLRVIVLAVFRLAFLKR